MDIHEYQAKEILAKFGVTVPAGALAYSPEQAAYRAYRAAHHGKKSNQDHYNEESAKQLPGTAALIARVLFLGHCCHCRLLISASRMPARILHRKSYFDSIPQQAPYGKTRGMVFL